VISAEPVGNVALLRLDRAAKKNALTPAMLRDLLGSIDRANSARAIVLAGAGDVFCAGFDLTLCKDDPQILSTLLDLLSQCCRALRTAPCPVVIAAHGAAIAGGCALLGGADVVVTDAGAKLGYPVVRLGISPAVSGPFVASSMGHGRARERMLDPELVSGTEALRLGLAHECVATAAEVLPRALEIAQILAQKPAHALAITRGWLNQIDPLLSQRERALAASVALVGTEEERTRLAEMWAARGASGSGGAR
jgi:enoyl-CoA hydratase/carnithine racemase